MHPARDDAARARRLWRLLEPLHAVTHFSPEPLAALQDAGYRGFWMCYFAGRVAPLGPVGPEVVRAVVHNFRAEHVERAIPAAWSFAPPRAAVTARLRGSTAALRRVLGPLADDRGVSVAADLAAEAALAAPVEGRPLFAAHRSLHVPASPVGRLWHAATLLREHRGDGHVAALLAAGVSGREAHVLHALAHGVPLEVYTASRHLEASEWSELSRGLRARGLVGRDGRLTAAGADLKQVVEDATDRAAATAYGSLDATALDLLERRLGPLARRVVRAGEIPVQSPTGLDLDEVEATQS